MKKWILGLLVAVFAICAASALVACTYDESGHNWSTKWSHDSRNHWHDCLDNDCSVRSDLASHIWELESTIESPTCDLEGLGNYKCSVCGEKKEDVIPATEQHLWKSGESREPSCYLPGFRITSCALCGKAVEEIIPATGNHVFDESSWQSDIDGHYHVCTTPFCNAISEHIPHSEDKELIRTVAPGEYKDGAQYYGCSVCKYVTSTQTLEATKIPRELQMHLSPVTGMFFGGRMVTTKWNKDAPDPVIVKEPNGDFSVTVYLDAGTSNPEYPYAIYFTGVNPLASTERVKVPIWGVGSTYGMTGYSYNTDTQSKSLLGYSGTVIFHENDSTPADNTDGYIRFRSLGERTLLFVFTTADDSDRTNQVDRTHIFVNVKVVAYGTAISAPGGIPLVLDVTPVIYFDGSIRKRVGI